MIVEDWTVSERPAALTLIRGAHRGPVKNCHCCVECNRTGVRAGVAATEVIARTSPLKFAAALLGAIWRSKRESR